MYMSTPAAVSRRVDAQSKFGSIPAEIEQRIQAAFPEELDRYVERVLFADSIAAVFA